MRRAILALIGALAAVAYLPTASAAPWMDGFESYAAGTALNNVGGWRGWDNVAAAAGVVSNAQAHSGSNSLQIGPNSDAIHPFAGITSGTWTLTAWQYIPRSTLTAPPTYFIVNNQYNDGGPYTWAIEMGFSATNVIDDFRPENAVATLFDQWIELRAVMNLDSNTASFYYNGSLVSTGAFNVNGGGLEIANLDLFTGNSGGNTVYYDDICLSSTGSCQTVPEPGTLALLGLGLAGLATTRRRKH